MNATPNTAVPTVSDLLCFDLYAVSRAITGFYRQDLDRAGITYPQFLVLTLLWEQDSRSMREIVRELGLDYNTLSPLVKRLENAGLVVRVTHPDDDRSVLVQLTEAGRGLQWIGNEMTGRLGEVLGLDGDEFSTLRRLLRTLKGNVIR